jgi:hypothetical protein
MGGVIGTGRSGDGETWRLGDKETRRQGDGELPSPLLPFSPSPVLCTKNLGKMELKHDRIITFQHY